MFDVSFSELVVIAIVALIVIGPEKLPKVARTLGALVGRMQRFVAQVKEEVNRDVRFQELQQLQQEIQNSASKAKNEIQTGLNDSMNSIKQDLNVAVLKAEAQTEPSSTMKSKKAPAKKVKAKKISVEE